MTTREVFRIRLLIGTDLTAPSLGRLLEKKTPASIIGDSTNPLSVLTYQEETAPMKKSAITLTQACDGLVRYKSAVGMSPNTHAACGRRRQPGCYLRIDGKWLLMLSRREGGVARARCRAAAHRFRWATAGPAGLATRPAAIIIRKQRSETRTWRSSYSPPGGLFLIR